MAKLKLRSAETVEEVDWLLGGGMSERELFELRRAEWVRLVVADVKSRMK